MDFPTNQTGESSTQTPLVEEGLDDETQLNRSLQHLETFLKLFGFCQNSLLTIIFSWFVFIFVGLGLPLFIILEKSNCSDCEKYQIPIFELEILVSESLVATISLFCISRKIRKYGLRRFLFVDREHGHRAQFRDDYMKKINDFFRLLALWIVPCFLLKTTREVLHIIYIHPDSYWKSGVILLISLLSWTYSTTIYLSGTALFNLVGNFQVIHLEAFGMLLERDLDVAFYIEEHILLTHHLSKISHRFRIFLLLEFLIVTASQFIALLETTENHEIINFINGGDFAVSSIYELAGILMCLHASAKISHRAQGLASVTSRWHALITCNVDNDSNNGAHSSTNGKQSEVVVVHVPGSLPITYSETDLDSTDYVPLPTNSQLASNMSLYNKRQALVLYLQTNPRGVTIFGWTIDRLLINTIFFIELSLVLFVLGKTITFTTI